MIKVQKKNFSDISKMQGTRKKLINLKKKKVAGDEKPRAPRQWQVYLENLITLNKVKTQFMFSKKTGS